MEKSNSIVKNIILNILIIIFIILVTVGIMKYKALENIREEYSGYVLSYTNKDIGKEFNAVLEIKLLRKIFNPNSFSGTFIIDDKKADITGIKKKNKSGDKYYEFLTVDLNKGDKGPSLIFFTSDDFKYIYGIGEKSFHEEYGAKKHDHIGFVAPASNEEEAIVIYEMFDKWIRGDRV